VAVPERFAIVPLYVGSVACKDLETLPGESGQPYEQRLLDGVFSAALDEAINLGPVAAH